MFLKKNVISIFFLCFRHIFLFKLSKLSNFSFFNPSKMYFFICINLWVNLFFSKLIKAPLIDFILIKNYNLLRFLEFYSSSNSLNVNFNSNFLSCSKQKIIVPFNNFKLKIKINLFLLTNSYLDFFRRFKYNEYLRKNNLKYLHFCFLIVLSNNWEKWPFILKQRS